jgi:hypothetical protein
MYDHTQTHRSFELTHTPIPTICRSTIWTGSWHNFRRIGSDDVDVRRDTHAAQPKNSAAARAYDGVS